MSQSPSPGKKGDSCLKAHLHISVQAEVLKRRRRRQNNEIKGGAWKFSRRRRAQSISIRQVVVWCAPSWFSRPGFMSSWLHVILAPQLKASKFPRTGLPESGSLYLLKLVPRLLVQTRSSSTSYILVRVGTYRNNVKRVVGWVTMLCHNFSIDVIIESHNYFYFKIVCQHFSESMN